MGVRRRLLRAFGRLPNWARRWLVRRGSPLFLVGASCVVEHDGRVLLCRHSYLKGWGLPGGGVGRDEVPAAAAVREVYEEVGLHVEPEERPALVADGGRLDVVYRCALVPGASPDDARPSSIEIDEVRWVAVDDLAGMSLNWTAQSSLRAAGVLRRPVSPGGPSAAPSGRTGGAAS